MRFFVPDSQPGDDVVSIRNSDDSPMSTCTRTSESGSGDSRIVVMESGSGDDASSGSTVGCLNRRFKRFRKN